MDSEKGGLSSAEKQRQTAAEIARRKVLDAYEQKGANVGQYKNVPVNPKVTAEDWQKYHSAWQNYYQKYYSEYYAKAAQQYVATERLKKEVQAVATDESQKARKRRHFAPLIAGAAVVLAVLFMQYNRLILTPVIAYISPGDAPATDIEIIDPTVEVQVPPEPKLMIPKLNLEVAVSFGIDSSKVQEAMNHGAAHFMIPGASAYPGQIGNLVISGHSSGDFYSTHNNKYIFSSLVRIAKGDLIYINYNSKRYVYSVTKTETVTPSNVGALVYETDKPMLTLVTCVPLGTSRYRLLVTAEQISPSYEDAETAPELEPGAEEAEAEEMPSNSPTLFQNIWAWLTGQL